MRIFIALVFKDSSIDELVELQNGLKDRYAGRYISSNNLHMTLAFLGEVEEALIPTLQTIVQNSFLDIKALQTNHINMLQKNILVLSFASCPDLMLYREVLVNNLKKKMFKIDNHPFVPHITLARDVSDCYFASKEYDKTLTISGVALMASTLLPNEARYQIIDFKKME